MNHANTNPSEVIMMSNYIKSQHVDINYTNISVFLNQMKKTNILKIIGKKLFFGKIFVH